MQGVCEGYSHNFCTAIIILLSDYHIVFYGMNLVHVCILNAMGRLHVVLDPLVALATLRAQVPDKSGHNLTNTSKFIYFLLKKNVYILGILS